MYSKTTLPRVVLPADAPEQTNLLRFLLLSPCGGIDSDDKAALTGDALHTLNSTAAADAVGR
jgi:hypothetical protein